MTDYMLRTLARDAGVRGLACVTTGLVAHASERHQAGPLATAALGYGLTAAALLGALLKVQQRVALKVEGSGPLQKLVVESDSYGHLRGYVAVPDAPSPPSIGPQEVCEGLGRQGTLTVVKDLRLKELYRSVTTLAGGTLDEELARYLNRSEQVPSLVEIGMRVGCGGEVEAAGGLLLQVLAGQEPAVLSSLADNLEDLPTLDVLLADGYTPEDILAAAYGGIDYEILEKRPLAFQCSCSRERSRQALKVLDRQDLETLLAEGLAVVDCHFCHERYVFGRKELAALLNEVNEPNGG